jgi:tRNA1Val (adenine37-N6)-methyltransferase
MPNSYFKFKQFIIYQENCAMKVGTDGVLLGAWVNAGKASTILDIGTGTGLIALMLAQRSEARIDAIDIDIDAVNQAKANIEKSPWYDRIHIIHEAFQTYSQKSIKYDLLVTNPPYFLNALKSADAKRSIARHDHQLSQFDLIEGAARLLDPDGKFGVILPFTEYQIFTEQMQANNLFENRKTLVFTKPGKKPARILAEFSFFKLPVEMGEIVIEKYGRHAYSEEYIELTRDYYIKF